MKEKITIKYEDNDIIYIDKEFVKYVESILPEDIYKRKNIIKFFKKRIGEYIPFNMVSDKLEQYEFKENSFYPTDDIIEDMEFVFKKIEEDMDKLEIQSIVAFYLLNFIFDALNYLKQLEGKPEEDSEMKIFLISLTQQLRYCTNKKLKTTVELMYKNRLENISKKILKEEDIFGLIELLEDMQIGYYSSNS